jgi:hypothetical protein
MGLGRELLRVFPGQEGLQGVSTSNEEKVSVGKLAAHVIESVGCVGDAWAVNIHPAYAKARV